METEPGKIPELEVLTDTGETVALNWINTVIRTYKDSAYNHIEWYDPKGIKLGFITPQSVMDALFELDFPYTFNPAISDKDREWYVELATAGLEEELDELRYPPDRS